MYIMDIFICQKMTVDYLVFAQLLEMCTGILLLNMPQAGNSLEKSDVFSLGVMLLELINGRKPVNTKNSYMDDRLGDWVSNENMLAPQARPQLARTIEDGIFETAVDPKPQGDYSHEELARMVACAAACVRHSARHRPRMSKVISDSKSKVLLIM